MHNLNETDIAGATAQQTTANNALLDLVAAYTGARTNAQLAALLGSHPPVISKIRHGKLPIGATLQIAMLETGIALSTLRLYVPSTVRGVARAAP